MRSGDFREAALERQLNNRGLVNRLLRRLTKSITRPWQVYPIVLLYGPGFHTATEVALPTGSKAASGLPWCADDAVGRSAEAGMGSHLRHGPEGRELDHAQEGEDQRDETDNSGVEVHEAPKGCGEWERLAAPPVEARPRRRRRSTPWRAKQ